MTCKNGSDESDLADQWYERAFGIWKDTRSFFSNYLYNYDIDVNDLIEDEDYFEEVYSEYLEDACNKECDSKEECLAIKKYVIINQKINQNL